MTRAPAGGTPRLATVMVCVLCCGGLAGRAFGEVARSEADRLASVGDREAAARLYEEAVTRDPENLEAQERLAVQRIALGRLQAVIGQLEPVVARHPERAGARYSLAYCYRRTGRSADAVRAYAAYVHLRPEDPDPYYGYALALRDAGDEQRARQVLGTYVEMAHRPEDLPWVERARAILREIDARRAAGPTGADADVEMRRTAVRDRPTDPAAWDRLEGTLRDAGRIREADAAKRRAERLRAGGDVAPARPAALREQRRPELVDALMPPQERGEAPDAAQAVALANPDRQERARAADEKIMRAEHKRLARAEARRLRAEKAAQRRAERETGRTPEADEAAKAVPEAAESARAENPAPLPIAPPPDVAPTVAPPVPPEVGPEDIERLRTAVRDDPEDARNWHLLSAALRSGGRTAEAAAAERRYTRLSARSPRP